MSEDLETLRHSTAHVMAAAVLDLFPGTVIGIGPATDEGFYYDFGFQDRLLPEQLPKIEARMHEIVKAATPFVKEEVPRAEAVAVFERLHQPLKVELIEEKVTEPKARLYRTGDFVDLCLGPHVANAGKLGAFRLLSIAGAYWKGSEKNQQLTRIYGTAFPTQEELDAHLKMLEEAAKRDHRKLGKELDLFLIDEIVGRGLPLLTPKGTAIRHQMEEFILRLERRQGYEHVKTPDIARLELYKVSGHLERYRDSMYAPSEIEDEEWQLRPMNCPHHIRLFQRKPSSFRDLPVRIAELGTVYRYEKSGEVSGLIRVRAFTINDAHIFCRPDQLNVEFERVIQLILQVYRAFGITDFYFRLSLRDEVSNKWMGDPAIWQRAQDAARDALRASVCRSAGGGRLLRAEARRADQRRHRSGVQPIDQPDRLSTAGALRAGVRDIRADLGTAGDAAPGADRLDGAVHGVPDRALWRCLPRLAGPGPGGLHPDRGPPPGGGEQVGGTVS
jgi:threonyl-tRNA synthetase